MVQPHAGTIMSTAGVELFDRQDRHTDRGPVGSRHPKKPKEIHH